MRYKATKRYAKRAMKQADSTHSDAISHQRVKSEFMKLTMERLAMIKQSEGQIEGLKRKTEKAERLALHGQSL